MIEFLWLVASVCFILALSGLSTQATARRGNLLGVIGMVLGIGATLASGRPNPLWMVAAMVPAAVLGAVIANRIRMESMPQFVALLHSFVGVGAMLVGVAGYYNHPSETLDAARVVHLVECYLGVIIGAITFTGSVVAFGKLQEWISSKPLLYPGRHMVTGGLFLVSLGLGAAFVMTQGAVPLWVGAALAGILGVLLVMSIGGADMPVVVSMLNSYSGWAAAATGFLLGNDLLIITGALVGSSGAILSHIMCKAMNRSLFNVILGGFGATAAGGPSEEAARLAAKGVKSTAVDDVVELMRISRQVIIVPGYGMAVAQAQHAVREMTELLQKEGATVRYAIHPVAGRLPGHMNVLLAEANVPYPIVLEMDDINQDFSDTDLVLVLGANDIVNPDALENPQSALAGRPVLEVWKSRTVVTIKRGLNPGFAGIDNPLYYRDNSLMLFGDARKMVEGLVNALKGAGHH